HSEPLPVREEIRRVKLRVSGPKLDPKRLKRATVPSEVVHALPANRRAGVGLEAVVRRPSGAPWMKVLTDLHFPLSGRLKPWATRMAATRCRLKKSSVPPPA